MILLDGRCFRCALGNCKRCTDPRCTHKHPPTGRWAGDPRTEPPPRRPR